MTLKIDEHFDANYYNRFYGVENDVVGQEYGEAEIRFVIGFCDYIGLDIERIVDVGAGTGWWRDSYTRLFSMRRPKGVQFDTYEASRDACRIYGHKRRTVLTFPTRPRAALLVCRDVLRYVSDAEAEGAIRRFADATTVLYLQVVTREDVAATSAADLILEGSDPEGTFRPAAWYLRRLKAAGFRNYGMGLFVHERHDIAGDSSILWGR